MKLLRVLRLTVLAAALGLSTCVLRAQETNEVEQLKKQLQRMQENFERTQREHREQMEALWQKLDALAAQQQASATAAVAAAEAPTAAPLSSWRPSDPIRVGRGNAYMDIGLVGTFAVGGSTADDIEGGTQLGGHDPNQNGFTIQGVELNLMGAVDPYFRGNANVLFSVDSEGESFFELEEAWLESISLPGNLQVRGGQFLTEFGRLNTQHPHSWSFVDTPLVNARFLGPDGLRNPGARLSWLAPTPFYSELFLGVQDSHGETAASFRSSGHSHGGEESEEGLPLGYRHADNDRGVSSVGDLLFTPRYAMSFDLTDSQTLVLGASAAFGPNSSGSSGDTVTQIYGVDVYWKWKSPNAHAGFPFVSFQSEAMIRRYELGTFDWVDEAGDEDGNTFIDEGILVDSTGTTPAALDSETVTDYGFYSQLLYGFRKGWVAGLRFDYVAGERADYESAGLLISDNAGGGTPAGRDPLRNQRWRISPNLTWYPSEFSKIRLQYNYDDRRDIGEDHSVWLQFEFLLGAHAAHKF
jgi:hypothetical protein